MKTITIDGVEYQLTPIPTEAPNPVQWEPKRLDEDQKYWCISGTGTLNYSRENYLIADDQRVSFGNYFHTEQEAEEAAKQVRQLLRLRTYVREFAPEWKANWSDDEKNKWHVCFDEKCNKWIISNNHFMHNVTVVYMPQEVAKELARKLNSGEVVL